MLLKQKSPSLPRNLAAGTFSKLLIVLKKGKSALPPLLKGPEMLSSASDKAKLFPKNFSNNSNLDDWGISLPVFPSRTSLKVHNLYITPKMVKKVIANIDSSKASGPDCVLVVVLKNCKPELLYILAELFNICLKESCFPNCWKVSLVVLLFKNVEENSAAKNYPPPPSIFFLWLVNSLKNL